MSCAAAAAIADNRVFPAFPEAPESSECPESQDAARLLEEARSIATWLTDDASVILAYTRETRSWKSHCENARRIREDIGRARRVLDGLGGVRESSPRRQQRAIDRICPLLRMIAGDTGDLLRSIEEDPGRLFKSEFQDYLETNAEMASRFTGLILALMDFELSLGRTVPSMPVRRP
jgi:hypothetical protein